MKRLILRTLILFLLTTSLTGGMVAYARTQPASHPLSEMGLGLCDQMPCFEGIRPGITPWEEARAVLKSVGAQETEELYGAKGLYISKEGAEIRVISSDDVRQVFEVQILADANSETLEHLILTFGSPCAVTESNMITTIYVIYPGLFAEIFVESGRVKMGSLLYRIELVQHTPPDLCSSFNDTAPYRWMGFTSMKRYAQIGFPIH